MGWQKALQVIDTKEPKQMEAASHVVLLQSPKQREEEEIMSKHWFFKLLRQNDACDFLSHFIEQIQSHSQN